MTDQYGNHVDREQYIDWPKGTDEFEGYGRPCSICGALVPERRQAKHEAWHRLIEAWIEPAHVHDFVLGTEGWTDCTICGTTRAEVLAHAEADEGLPDQSGMGTDHRGPADVVDTDTRVEGND